MHAHRLAVFLFSIAAVSLLAIFLSPGTATAAEDTAGQTAAKPAAESPAPKKPPGAVHENLVLGFPAGGHPWHLDGTREQNAGTLRIFIQEGETQANWSEMITSMTFKNHPDWNTGDLIGRGVQSLKAICKTLDILQSGTKDQIEETRQKEGEDPSYTTYSVLVRCDDPRPDPGAPNLKKHEVVWFKGVQGWKTSYIVQRAWHSDDIPADSILASSDTRKTWQDWSDGIGVSDAPGAPPTETSQAK